MKLRDVNDRFTFSEWLFHLRLIEMLLWCEFYDHLNASGRSNFIITNPE